MSVGVIGGNAFSIHVVTATVDMGSVAANTSEEETATVTGVKVGDFVAVNKSDLDTGAAICNARVSAANTVILTVMNTTASAIDAASETMTFLVIRPERAMTAVSA